MVRRKSLASLKEYETEAKRKLSQKLIDYIYSGSEYESTLKRNVESYSKFLLRRRVLQGVQHVDTDFSYFDGRIQSELPFFPSCINVSEMYPDAILDVLKVSKRFKVPILISEISLTPPEFSHLPKLVNGDSPLIWQIYLRRGKREESLRRAERAKSLGYSGVAITVDTELNIKLGFRELEAHDFLAVTPGDIREVRRRTSLPLIVKGVMTGEDAKIAIESGADGVVVSNHGARILDQGQATIEVLPEIVKEVRSKRSTRHAEIFLDGGIRKGTDILKALALGSRGCLLGRPIFWGLALDRQNGVGNVMQILKSELIRAAALCGVRKLSEVDPRTVVRSEDSGAF